MDGDVLAAQLAQLGKQLDEATVKLAELDVLATGRVLKLRTRKNEYEDALGEAFRDAEGAVEARKIDARLRCKHERWTAQDAAAAWERAKSAGA